MSAIYNTRELAINHLRAKEENNYDGERVIARYWTNGENSEIASVEGIWHKVEGVNNLEIKDGSAAIINDLETRIAELEARIENCCGDESANYLMFTNIGNTGTYVNISIENNGGNAPIIYYSKGGSDFVQWDYTTLQVDDEPIVMYGENEGSGFSKSETQYSRFTFSGDGVLSASGYVESLVSSDIPDSLASYDYCFYRLFADDSLGYLVKGPDFSAKTLGKHCYERLFEQCLGLRETPAMEAINLAERCCTLMFSRCDSLTEISPNTFKHAWLAERCYDSMFYECRRLANAKNLAAPMELAPYCYHGMFEDCASLVEVPSLPSTSLAKYCYARMFKGTSVSQCTMPKLPAVIMKEGCYYEMFAYCDNISYNSSAACDRIGLLNDVKILAEDCFHGMFSYCTNLRTPFIIPRVSPVRGCCAEMFKGCTTVTRGWVYLSGITLDNCNDYVNDMFSGCTLENDYNYFGVFSAEERVIWQNIQNAYPNIVPSHWYVQRDTSHIDYPDNDGV